MPAPGLLLLDGSRGIASLSGLSMPSLIHPRNFPRANPRIRSGSHPPASEPSRRRPRQALIRPKIKVSCPECGQRRQASGHSWVADLQRQHDGLIQALRLAEEVQQSLLPRKLPDLPGIKLGASLRPCHYLAGDFYNAVRLDHDRVGIFVGDVMGHGPAAALLGVFAMQSLRLKRIDGSSYEIVPPAAVLDALNREMIDADFPGTPFLTMIYATYNLASKVLTYCSGGHPAAMLLRPGQTPDRLPCNSSLLGVFEAPYQQESVHLDEGCRIAFFSDGFELISWGEYGEGLDGLGRLLSIRDGRSPQELVDSMMAQIGPNGSVQDDLTVVLMEVQPAG